MKILDRYVGSSVLFTAFFGVVVLSLVLVLGNIFKELLDLIINKDVPLQNVLAFMLYVLPFSLTFTIPWGFLTALLLIFGRLSADNEMIALRSNGVSILRICVPVFILAATLTGICFWINIEIAPRAEQKMTQAIFDIATNNPSSLFSSDEVVDDFPDRRVYVGSKQGDHLKNIIVFELDQSNVPTKMVYAREGVIESDVANKRLLLKFSNARFEQRDAHDPRDITKIRQGIVMREGSMPLSLVELYNQHTSGRRLSSFTLNELFAEMSKELTPGRRLETRVEFNKRFSSALACMAFALIAIPLGVTTHRKETSVGFALSLVIAFTYFFFIIMADTFRGNVAAHPTVLIWLPNVIFISLGSVLFWRLARR